MKMVLSTPVFFFRYVTISPASSRSASSSLIVTIGPRSLAGLSVSPISSSRRAATTSGVNNRSIDLLMSSKLASMFHNSIDWSSFSGMLALQNSEQYELFNAQPKLSHQRPPFALLAIDIGLILPGRRGQRIAAVGGDTGPHVVKLNRLPQLGVKAHHNVRRRAGRRHQAVVEHGLEARQAGFRNGWHIGHQAQALGAGGRDCPQ